MQQDNQQQDDKVYQKIYFKTEAQEKILEGARILAEAVGSTMGPSGHNVIIEEQSGTPKITKDGVTVAKAIKLKDKLNAVGSELLKEVASKTNDITGDGTTTATVLGYNLLKEGIKLIASGRSAIHVKRGMDQALEVVSEFLKTNSIPISNTEEIVNVATISANGDKEIGRIIAQALSTVGADGLIAIENGKTLHTNLKLAEGIQVDSGFLSPWFITNSEKQICELENPAVLITPNKISGLQEILPLLEQIDKTKRALLIIADDVEGEALHTLVVNKTRGIIKVCAIKAPGYGEYRADVLADLGVVVDGAVLGATSEISIQKIKLDNIGKCKKAVITRNSCMLLVEDNNQKVKDNIKQRANELREALKTDLTLDALRKEKYKQRLAKLSGGIAIIEVGGSTEIEVLEKRDRVEDAVNATQAAAQEGIVPGGGTALFYASLNLKSMIHAGFFANQNLDEDTITGIQLIATVCEAPFKTIVSNTGVSPEVIAERLKQNWSDLQAFFVDPTNINPQAIHDFINQIETKQSIESFKALANVDNNKKFKFGYNALTKTYGDLVKEGIIDPVKVSRSALTNAVSIIGLLLTCNAIIVNE